MARRWCAMHVPPTAQGPPEPRLSHLPTGGAMANPSRPRAVWANARTPEPEKPLSVRVDPVRAAACRSDDEQLVPVPPNRRPCRRNVVDRRSRALAFYEVVWTRRARERGTMCAKRASGGAEAPAARRRMERATPVFRPSRRGPCTAPFGRPSVAVASPGPGDADACGGFVRDRLS